MMLRSLAGAALVVALMGVGAAHAQAPPGAQSMSDAEAKAVAQKVVMACEADIARHLPSGDVHAFAEKVYASS